MPGQKPEWSTQGGIAQRTQPARAAVVTSVPKAQLENVIARTGAEITQKNARIAELQAEVTELTTDKASMEAVLASVTGDPA